MPYGEHIHEIGLSPVLGLGQDYLVEKSVELGFVSVCHREDFLCETGFTQV